MLNPQEGGRLDAKRNYVISAKALDGIWLIGCDCAVLSVLRQTLPLCLCTALHKHDHLAKYKWACLFWVGGLGGGAPPMHVQRQEFKVYDKVHNKIHDKAHEKVHDKAHDKVHEKVHEKVHDKVHDKCL